MLSTEENKKINLRKEAKEYINKENILLKKLSFAFTILLAGVIGVSAALIPFWVRHGRLSWDFDWIGVAVLFVPVILCFAMVISSMQIYIERFIKRK